VPDAAWISRGRLHDVPPRRRRAILPIAPEFVVEIRSETDDLGELMEKMSDWLSDGVLLGLLIDPQTHTAYVFAVDRAEPEVISDVFTDQAVLPGFRLDLTALWAAFDDLFVE
jgi:Uma2 family endonuclease